MSADRLLLVVSLWLRDGDVDGFEAFERRASSLLAGHGGRIERVVRCADASTPETPFEIHIVSFPSSAAFAAYRADPAVVALAAERDAVIARTAVVAGRERAPY